MQYPFVIMHFLSDYYFLIMRILLFSGAIFFVLNTNNLLPKDTVISKKTWMTLAVIIVVAFVIRIFFVPHMHHVYFDEYEHVNLATNLLNHGKFFVTYQGGPDNCSVSNFQFWPPGYHVLLSFIFSVFSASEKIAYFMNVFLGGASIAVFFFLLFYLFKDQEVALYSSLFFSLIPTQMKYSGSTALGIVSLFFILLTLWAALVYINSTKKMTLALLISMLSVTVYLRPENIIVVFLIPLAAVLLVTRKENDRGIYFKHIVVFFCAMGVIMIPYFLQLYLSTFHPPAGWGDSIATRWDNFNRNLFDNLSFWICGQNPFVFIPFVCMGIYSCLCRNRKLAVFLLIWFIAFFLFYTQYHIGNFLFSDGDRYTLNLYISVVVFAGLGVAWVVRRFGYAKLLIPLIVVIAVTEGILGMRFGVRKTLQSEQYAQHQFLLVNKDKIPEDLYVVCFEPAVVISSIQKKAVYPDLVLEMETLPEKIVLFKDYWWYRLPASEKIELFLKKHYNFEIIVKDRSLSDSKISFYLLNLKKQI